MTSSKAVRAALTAALALGLVAAPASAAAAEPEAAQSQAAPIAWGKCAEDVLALIPVAERPKVSCANHPVPLDHSRANGAKIDIALMKRPAPDQSKKIGSLFINPGGPGGAGLRYAGFGANFFTPEVMERFDLIGFDPRGVGRSTPLRCFKTSEEADAVFNRMYDVPVSKQEIDSHMTATKDYTRACAQNAGPLLKHMATEDVARDLDLFRAGVGDKELTYVGFSYGTLLGATYANLFPQRSRAIVIDGNVDPKLRTHNGTQYDRERAQGFEIALDGFLKRCDAVGPKCALSGGARKKFDALREAVKVKPVTLPNGTVVKYGDLIGRVAGNLYQPATFTALAAWLQSIHAVLNPGVMVAQDAPELAPAHNGRLDFLPLEDGPYLADDSYYGVNCTDKPFVRAPQLFPFVAKRWERESPTFGRSQAASDLLTCASWPVPFPDRYSGPWNRKTKNPVVVVGNYYDPATQYEFARRMARQLGNARLISVDAFGHCILGKAAGADAAVTRYLVDLKAPDNGQVFHPNVQPFA
ncbi:alpha/beta hydrolase [Lentzea tibetensis]|uniref:alpha/beta hydrolase n=1 Tax=Lentzea tibetensis TaxID=2591470 RepID=UPI0016485A33|nr:alpha/beta hydrolase [Lentzea tibetensis]